MSSGIASVWARPNGGGTADNGHRASMPASRLSAYSMMMPRAEDTSSTLGIGWLEATVAAHSKRSPRSRNLAKLTAIAG